MRFHKENHKGHAFIAPENIKEARSHKEKKLFNSFYGGNQFYRITKRMSGSL